MGKWQNQILSTKALYINTLNSSIKRRVPELVKKKKKCTLICIAYKQHTTPTKNSYRVKVKVWKRYSMPVEIETHTHTEITLLYEKKNYKNTIKRDK